MHEKPVLVLLSSTRIRKLTVDPRAVPSIGMGQETVMVLLLGIAVFLIPVLSYAKVVPESGLQRVPLTVAALANTSPESSASANKGKNDSCMSFFTSHSPFSLRWQ